MSTLPPIWNRKIMNNKRKTTMIPPQMSARNGRVQEAFRPVWIVFTALGWDDEDDLGYSPDEFFDDTGYTGFDDDDGYADEFDDVSDDDEDSDDVDDDDDDIGSQDDDDDFDFSFSSPLSRPA